MCAGRWWGVLLALPRAGTIQRYDKVPLNKPTEKKTAGKTQTIVRASTYHIYLLAFATIDGWLEQHMRKWEFDDLSHLSAQETELFLLQCIQE